jgi:N-acetylmuramoyl-L-alanine amidase
MAIDHVVKQGEHISRIAEKYGFLDHRTIWEHPENASLKNLRDNPWILFPGDVVHIPDKLVKKELVPTTKTHTFKLKLERLKLKVAVKDHEDNPIANTPLQMNVEGSVKSLTTDGDGKAEREILKSAAKGMVTITDFEIPLRIGDLDPVEELSGQKARLNNLGYDAGDPRGPEGPDDQRFRSAVEEFQCDNDLDVTGVCDEGTQVALEDKHGS